MMERITMLEQRLNTLGMGAILRRNVPAATMTTLHLGGPVDLLAEPMCAQEVQLLLKEAAAVQVPVTVIGHGSNLLVLDGGIRGLAIRMERSMNGVTIDGHTLSAEGGAMLAVIARKACEAGLAGLTFAGGIPGTAGGGVLMNAGAYGGEMSQVVTLVEGFRMDGEPFRYTGEEMAFGHRSSRLQRENVVVTRVTFALGDGEPAALMAEMQEYNRRRAEKQPLELPSAGSTFKRPVGGYASALIDECGLKGCTVGGAQVSEKHAGFCVNLGGTAEDFLGLMAEVQRVVLEKKGILLEP